MSGSDPAFPTTKKEIVYQQHTQSKDGSFIKNDMYGDIPTPGLTKRELFAAMAREGK